MLVKTEISQIQNKIVKMTFNELLNSDILKDVLDNPNSLIHIDIDDIKDLFQQESEIHAFNVKVGCFEEQRMELLMKQLKEETKSNLDFSRALFYIFYPVCHPLLMSELHHIYEWMESIPVEIMMKWGMATQSTQEIRAIVLLQ